MDDDSHDLVPKAAPSARKTQAAGKDDRLAAALKANMARRKAQARARTADRRTAEEQEQP